MSDSIGVARTKLDGLDRRMAIETLQVLSVATGNDRDPIGGRQQKLADSVAVEVESGGSNAVFRHLFRTNPEKLPCFARNRDRRTQIQPQHDVRDAVAVQVRRGTQRTVHRTDIVIELRRKYKPMHKHVASGQTFVGHPGPCRGIYPFDDPLPNNYSVQSKQSKTDVLDIIGIDLDEMNAFSTQVDRLAKHDPFETVLGPKSPFAGMRQPAARFARGQAKQHVMTRLAVDLDAQAMIAISVERNFRAETDVSFVDHAIVVVEDANAQGRAVGREHEMSASPFFPSSKADPTADDRDRRRHGRDDRDGSRTHGRESLSIKMSTRSAERETQKPSASARCRSKLIQISLAHSG